MITGLAVQPSEALTRELCIDDRILNRLAALKAVGPQRKDAISKLPWAVWTTFSKVLGEPLAGPQLHSTVLRCMDIGEAYGTEKLWSQYDRPSVMLTQGDIGANCDALALQRGPLGDDVAERARWCLQKGYRRGVISNFEKLKKSTAHPRPSRKTIVR